MGDLICCYQNNRAFQSGNSFFNVLKHAEKYPKSNLAIILANKHVPISSITKNFGSKTIRKYRTKFDLLYPMQDKKTSENYVFLWKNWKRSL